MPVYLFESSPDAHLLLCDFWIVLLLFVVCLVVFSDSLQPLI